MDKKIELSKAVIENIKTEDVKPIKDKFIDTEKYDDVYLKYGNNKSLIISCFHGIGKDIAFLHTKYKMVIKRFDPYVVRNKTEDKNEFTINPHWEQDFIEDTIDLYNENTVDIIAIDYQDTIVTKLHNLGYNVIVVYPDNEMRFTIIQDYIKKGNSRLANILHAGWEDIIKSIEDLPEDIVRIKLDNLRYLSGLI